MSNHPTRFLVFADLHHHPGGFKTDAPDRLERIRHRAAEEQVDFVIHLGDLCHAPSRSPELLAQYHAFPMPVFHTLGNHDSDETPRLETLELYGLGRGYNAMDLGGFRFVRLDTNYYRCEKDFIPYDLGNHFKLPLAKENLNWIPPGQLAWLRETVTSSQHPCILLSHCSLEREEDGIGNRAAVLRLIRETQTLPGRVILSLAGHHHRDHLIVMQGTAFFEVNSASFDWVPAPHRLYPAEWYAAFQHMGHMVIYNDPLSAIITLSGDGEMEIAGMQSSMLLGITRDMTGNALCDNDNRPCTPRISSARLRFG